MATNSLIPRNGTLGECRHCGANLVWSSNLNRWVLDGVEPIPYLNSTRHNVTFPFEVNWDGIHACPGHVAYLDWAE